MEAPKYIESLISLNFFKKLFCSNFSGFYNFVLLSQIKDYAKAVCLHLYPVIDVTVSGIFSMMLSTSLVNLAGPRLSSVSAMTKSNWATFNNCLCDVGGSFNQYILAKSID